MKTYLVSWEIHIDAASPREAAQLALDIQRQPDSIATSFDVTDPTAPMTITIDLGET